jgi:hypothetical protein
MLEIAVAGQSVQVACQDDGDFPDEARNDDRAVCAGVAGAGDLVLRLRTPSEEDQVTLNVGPEVAVVQGRWTAGGLEQEARLLLRTLASTAQALPSGDVLPAPKGGESVHGGPAVKPPEAPANPGLWAGVLALFTGLVGWRLGRGPRGERALPACLDRVAGKPLVQEVPDLAMAWSGVSSQDPVVLLQVDEAVPVDHMGAVLRSRSTDVLDILDAVAGLAARDPLRSVGLILGSPDALGNPGGIGVAALDVLRQELPPGVRCFVVAHPAVP